MASQETIDRVQGSQEAPISDLSKEIQKSFDKTQKDYSGSLSKQFSENAEKQIGAMMDMAKPGSLIKSVGMMTGSPFIMAVGDQIGSLLEFEDEKAQDEEKAQEDIKSLLDKKGFNEEQIQEVLKARGKSDTEMATLLSGMGVTLEEIESASDDGSNHDPNQDTTLLDNIEQNTRGDKDDGITSVLENIADNTTPTEDFEQEQRDNDSANREERQLTFLERQAEMLEGISDKIGEWDQGEGFWGAMMGMAGLTIALVLAPFVAMSAFFIELAKKTKSIYKFLLKPLVWTKNIIFGILKKFESFRNLSAGVGNKLQGIKTFFRNLLTPFDKIDDVTGQVKKFGKIKKIFDPIKKIFTGIKAFFSNLQVGGTKVGHILRAAKGFGKTLGKFFYPITILMGIFDFATGFYKGFQEGGIIEGIKQGVNGLLDGLLYSLLSMIGKALSWIFSFLGMDNFAAGITAAVGTIITSISEMVGGVIDLVKAIFTGDWSAIGGILSGLFGNWLSIITTPINLAWALIKDIFSFAGFELPDWDIQKTIMGFIDSIKSFVTEKANPLAWFRKKDTKGSDIKAEIAAKEKQAIIDADNYDKKHGLGIYKKIPDANKLTLQNSKQAEMEVQNLDKQGTAKAKDGFQQPARITNNTSADQNIVNNYPAATVIATGNDDQSLNQQFGIGTF